MKNSTHASRLAISLAAFAAIGLTHAQPTPLKTLAAARGVTIGVAVSFPNGGEGSAARTAYDSLIVRNFGGIVAENDHKWGNVQQTNGGFSWANADRMVDFAVKHNLRLRYHAFVWHQQSSFMANGHSNNVAQPTNANAFDRPGAFREMKEHIDTVMTRYKTRNPGAIYEWDVVNEAVARDSAGMRLSTGQDSLLSRWVGYTQGETHDFDYVDSAFVYAHRADTSARLVYNDYDAEHMGVKGNLVFGLVSKLKTRNIPLHVVGMQCHWHMNQPGTTSNGGWDPTQFTQNMNRIAALGLDISITELDIRIQGTADSVKLAQQRQAYEQALSLCLAQPRCKNFFVWGVRDGSSWILQRYPGYTAPLLFSGTGTTYTPKPAYDGLVAVLSAPAALRAPGERQRALTRRVSGKTFDLRGRQMKSLPAGPSFKARKSSPVAAKR